VVASEAQPGEPSRPDRLGLTEGLAVLHLFVKLGPGTDSESLLAAVKRVRDDGVQVVSAAILGHKADACFMALGPDLWQLQRFQSALRGAGAEIVWSYTSVTELSEYGDGLPAEMKQARLYPVLPPEDKPAFCFYPMSKRRGEQHNWYELDFDSRKELMIGHGAVGRLFRGRVVQVVTGSTGLDDWEWGVTLFGVNHDDLKDCVYKMRFDIASSRYAEFGPFITGIVAEPETVVARITGG
jgi:hydrogen peroxide-dependent heme synthase